MEGVEGGAGGGGQAYSLLSTSQGHIIHCKLDSVVYAGVYAGVDVPSCFGPVLFGPNGLRPAVSRKESLRPLY